jgi:hypothetical protein
MDRLAKIIATHVGANRKGHVGAIYPIDSREDPAPALYDTLATHSRRIASIRLECSAEGVSVKKCSCASNELANHWHYHEVRTLLEALSERAQNTQSRGIAAVIGAFHASSLPNQIAMLEQSRSFSQEFDKEIYCCVISGSWNLELIKAKWDPKASIFDSSKVVRLESPDTTEITRLLVAEGMFAHAPGWKEQVAVELIHASTGGAKWLCDELLMAIRNRGCDWTDHIESILHNVGEGEHVCDIVAKRLGDLSQRQKLLIQAILKYQVVTLDNQDSDGEELWVRGLVHKTDRPPRWISLRVSSPVIERRLRLKMFPDGGDVAAELTPGLSVVNRRAYEIIFRIENFLRNLVVLELGRNLGADWAKALHKVSVRGGQYGGTTSESEEDFRKIIDRRLGELGLIPSGTQPGMPSKSAENNERETAFDSAQKWKIRMGDHPSVNLVRANLASFLTTGELAGILQQKELYRDHFAKYFSEKNDLNALLHEIIDLRDVIAHNMSVSHRMLDRLAKIEEDLERRVGNWVRSQLGGSQ